MARKRTTMTALEMQKALQQRGYSVALRFRKDGGYRISKINDKSYKGSEGNVEARKLLGVSLTQAQQKHLQKIAQAKGEWSKRLPSDLNQLRKEINKEFKKNGQSAKITFARLRKKYKEEGMDETRKYLEHMRRYVKNYVNDESLEGYIERLMDDIRIRQSTDGTIPDEYIKLMAIISKIRDVIGDGKLITQDDFAIMKDITYSWEENKVSINTLYEQVSAILERAD